MVVDLARHLSSVKLGRRIPVIGVGQLPSSGDGDVGPNLFPTLNEIDCMLDGRQERRRVRGLGAISTATRSRAGSWR